MKMGRDSWLKPATWAQMKTEVGRRGQVAGFAGIRSQAHSYKTTDYSGPMILDSIINLIV